MAMASVYLDYNATTPVAAPVLAALLPHLQQCFGNASSSYALGQQAKQAVERARGQVASMLEAEAPSEILFLSGGTESINYALKGSAELEESRGARKHIITSAVEHVAVLETCRYLESKGYDVTYLPVDESGCVDVNDVITAVTPATFLITVMLANNEVGTLQPVAEIVRRVKELTAEKSGEFGRVLIHTDASQAIGKLRVSVRELGVDFLTIAGHKLYAPKGVGALYIRQDAPLPVKLIHGASHEHSRRAGTENVSFDVALGEACALIERNVDQYATDMRIARNFLLQALREKLDPLGVACHVNGSGALVLPNTLSVSFRDFSAIDILRLIEADGIYASAGSACHSHNDSAAATVSHVLVAMKLPRDLALGTIRLSVGRETTHTELARAASVIATAIQSLK